MSGWGVDHRLWLHRRRYSRQPLDARSGQRLPPRMEKHEKIVNRLVTVSITQSQFDALVSFNYNCGALAKSTLLRS